MPDPPSPGPPLRAHDLEYLRKHAKQLLRAARSGDAPAGGPCRPGGDVPAGGPRRPGGAGACSRAA